MRYLILQPDFQHDNSGLRFHDYNELTDTSLVDPDRYRIAYYGIDDYDTSSEDQINKTLESLYFMINNKETRPHDYRGYMIAPANIIGIKRYPFDRNNYEFDYYYVNSTDFMKLPDFIIPEAQLKSAL